MYTKVLFFLSFFLDKSRKLSKIVSVVRSASVERFVVSRMRDFSSSKWFIDAEHFYAVICFAYREGNEGENTVSDGPNEALDSQSVFTDLELVMDIDYKKFTCLG